MGTSSTLACRWALTGTSEGRAKRPHRPLGSPQSTVFLKQPRRPHGVVYIGLLLHPYLPSSGTLQPRSASRAARPTAAAAASVCRLPHAGAVAAATVAGARGASPPPLPSPLMGLSPAYRPRGGWPRALPAWASSPLARALAAAAARRRSDAAAAESWAAAFCAAQRRLRDVATVAARGGRRHACAPSVRGAVTAALGRSPSSVPAWNAFDRGVGGGDGAAAAAAVLLERLAVAEPGG